MISVKKKPTISFDVLEKFFKTENFKLTLK